MCSIYNGGTMIINGAITDDSCDASQGEASQSEASQSEASQSEASQSGAIEDKIRNNIQGAKFVDGAIDHMNNIADRIIERINGEIKNTIEKRVKITDTTSDRVDIYINPADALIGTLLWKEEGTAFEPNYIADFSFDSETGEIRVVRELDRELIDVYSARTTDGRSIFITLMR